MSLNVQNKIVYRIRGKGRGWVFSPKHFLDLGSRDAVDKALSRLADAGVIRRFSRGLYDYPKISPQLGTLTPSADKIAKVLATKDQTRRTFRPSPSASCLSD